MDYVPELKYVDNFEGGTEVASDTARVYLLNDVVSGDDETERNGRQIDCHAIKLHAVWKTNAGHTVPSTCRVLIVTDTMNNGLFINSQAAADAWLAEVLVVNDPLSLLKMPSKPRFEVIYDQIFCVAASEQNPNSFVVFNEVIHLEDPVTTYFNGTGGTGAAISSNAIYLVFMSDAATTAGPSMQMNVRLRFTE